jgi:transposase
MRKIEGCLYVGPSDQVTLERMIADGKTPQKIAKRATIALMSGRGYGTNAICRAARVSKPTVWRWQEAYMEGGLARLLKDKGKGKGPRAGKPRVSDDKRLEIVRRAWAPPPRSASRTG